MLDMKGVNLVFLPYENIQVEVSVGGRNSDMLDIELTAPLSDLVF